jgi:hypothetical protein
MLLRASHPREGEHAMRSSTASYDSKLSRAGRWESEWCKNFFSLFFTPYQSPDRTLGF